MRTLRNETTFIEKNVRLVNKLPNKNNKSLDTTSISSREVKLVNVFELNQEFKIKNPYNAEEALKYLENEFDYEEYLENMLSDNKDNKDKKVPFEYTELPKGGYKTGISELFIATSYNHNINEEDNILNDDLHVKKEIINNEIPTRLIKLIDLSQFLTENSNKDKSKMDLIYKSEDGQFIIKLYIDKSKILRNLADNFIFDNNGLQSKVVKYNEINNNESCEDPQLDFFLQLKKVNSITFNEDDKNGDFEIIFEMKNPPNCRSNFMNSSSEKNEFKDCLFPFRDFNNNLNNLKFRNFYFIVKIKNAREYIDNIYDDLESSGNKAAKNVFIFKDTPTIIKEEKEFENVSIETVFRKMNEILGNSEASLVIIYQFLVLISENILTYYTCYYVIQSLNKEKFEILKNLKELYNALDLIIDEYKNTNSSMNVELFKNLLIEKYNIFVARSLNIKKSSESFEGAREESSLNSQVKILSVKVTPMLTYFQPIKRDKGNHLIRNYLKVNETFNICLDAIRITFQNEYSSRFDNLLLVEYMKDFLYKGIQFNFSENHDLNKNWQFFGYSNSQFRELSCWGVINRDCIIKVCGNFTGLKTVSKFGARVGLLLTTTDKTIEIDEKDVEYENDIERNDFVFTDGCGQISYDLAVRISQKLGLINNDFSEEDVPSVFQARFMGCKGVWVVNRNKDWKGKILIRPSQEKFKMVSISNLKLIKEQATKENNKYLIDLVNKALNKRVFDFNVKDISKFNQGFLNRQVILLLEQRSLGIVDEIFLDLLKENNFKLKNQKFIFNLISNPLFKELSLKMIENNFNIGEDRLLKSLMNSNKTLVYKELKNKARIFVEDSTSVIGVSDDIYNDLDLDEAFLYIKKDNYDLVLEGYAVVVKCPCLYPGDIRKLTFKRFNPKDESTKKFEKYTKTYKNCLVFSIKGNRPIPDQIAGSDLDGDNYFVYFDKRLIPEEVVLPMSYKNDFKSIEKINPTFDDVLTYFSEYTIKSNLGLIADAHLAVSDELGAKNEKAKIFSEYFFQAVDAPKSGQEIKIKEEENPTKYPHYMNKSAEKSFRSKSILGQLYNKTIEYEEKLSANSKIQSISTLYNLDFIYKECKYNYKCFILEGLINYSKYFEKIRKF